MRHTTMWRLLRGVPVLPALTLLLLVPGSAGAQAVVSPQQNLQFGMLTPGVQMVVEPTDVVRRGAFIIDSRGRFDISFILPAQLHNAHGASIPLSFGPTDGRIDIRHKITTFDPKNPVNIHINPSDLSAAIFIGGRAAPAASTPAGSYSASIVLVVVQTGT